MRRDRGRRQKPRKGARSRASGKNVEGVDGELEGRWARYGKEDSNRLTRKKTKGKRRQRKGQECAERFLRGLQLRLVTFAASGSHADVHPTRFLQGGCRTSAASPSPHTQTISARPRYMATQL